MGFAPRCSGLCLFTRTGKKKVPCARRSYGFSVVDCGLLSDKSAIPLPGSPHQPRCRDTTSCVGVGRVDTHIQRVKKHRGHNWGSLFICTFNDLYVFLPQETPVNTAFFDACRNRARHKNLCPPDSHRLRTSRPQDAHPPLGKHAIAFAKETFSGHQKRDFKPLESTRRNRRSGAMRDPRFAETAG
jgi:hypothetical protein